MSLAEIAAITGGALLVLGLLSRAVERLALSTVLLATLLGVVLGPHAAGVVDPADPRGTLEGLAAVTLAIALMATGLQVTRGDLRENGRRAGALLTAGMLAMWLVASLGAWLLLDLPGWQALLLGAIVTPTDPVVATVIVTAKSAQEHLPRRLRLTLQIEAGANDGLALPLVLLGGTMAAAGGLAHWAGEAVLEVAVAVVFGAALGHVTARAADAALHREEIEPANLAGLGIALALAAFGFTRLLGGSGVLAAFIAALAFSVRLEPRARERLEEVQEAVAKFFVLPAFILFGAVIPWGAWSDLGVAGALFAVWVLFLRRPAAVAVALPSRLALRRERLFAGWFGPIGVAALFYATYAERFGVGEYERIYAAATLAVAASVLAHSLTAMPGVRLFAGRAPFATLRHPLREES